jgi:type II secretory ATPase GspE/PulE/Tfp pilus assembly ATPase PilB-like protein
MAGALPLAWELDPRRAIVPEDIEVMVNTWLREAFARHASDVHFEPDHDDKMRVRMRVDGALRQVASEPDSKKIVARLKVMAALDVNERSVPLDGRISFDNGLDIRVSTNPCVNGEKIVCRLINNRKVKTSIEELGMSKKMLAYYEPLTQSPNGLILHVGPTGSGKTTSLYAVLQSLNKPEINIQTVEDPVEYQLQGITQTQVNHEQGLTFPRVLRALLRQDPNVILVGEIRDVETAEIATEAALTGHLVLSTLHTNDAVGTVVRLLEMGIAPYCIAYALRCVVAQRFVKRLCKDCRKQVGPDERVQKVTGVSRPVYEAEGCKECNRTGFTGRIPLFEFMPMTPPLRRAIYQSSNPDELAQVAAKAGMISLWQDGLDKVFGAATTLEEVMRATKGVKTGGGPTAPPLARAAGTTTATGSRTRPPITSAKAAATASRRVAAPRPSPRPPS